ncbi:RNA-binding S4 domain-containing protein [Candidatus Mycoplasma mahonii]|uniref:RNA-binding S4 domain-containing protein n=1 Tax=Candidatus Mycoplasma mahonii TaxID=3004105 RepID=UPI0026EF5B5B|nr:RNA-binding S4 domain-containing protein [Candidatus Mycoplasma mahonii]WKX02426.1 RNA-binding S4 domain-containing protein [Candidatus Mycoplasma mahonii]
MKIVIRDKSIKINQLLKKINVISTGGEAKYFLENNSVKINGKVPEGRGSKVSVGSTLWINGDLYQVINE